MRRNLKKALRSKKAVSLTGYGLLLGLISILAIASLQNLGGSITSMFESVDAELANVSPGAGSGSGGSSTGGSSSGGATGPSGQSLCPANPVEAQPPAGDIGCDDGFGNFYVGTSNGEDMYVFATDEGSFVWNDGSTNYLDTGLSNTATSDGEANTEALAAGDDNAHFDSATPDVDGGGANGGTVQPDGTAGLDDHIAAETCAQKTGDFSDWYLPAIDELEKIYDNLVDQDGNNTANPEGSSIFGFNTAGDPFRYWSSTENPGSPTGTALETRMSIGGQLVSLKSDSRLVRCARRQ